MKTPSEERKNLEWKERLKVDFCGTMMEGIDLDWLDSLPKHREKPITDVEEIRKYFEDQGKEIR